MKAFEASFETIVWRYYLLMTVVIVPFFLGVPLLSLIALPIFLISILGISFKKEKSVLVDLQLPKEKNIKVQEYRNPLNKAS